MEFTKEFLNNAMFTEQPAAFDPLRGGEPGRGPAAGAGAQGAEYMPNGDILFTVRAQGAETVSIRIGGRVCELEKGADGVFRGTYAYDPEACGPHSADVVVDGNVWIDPYLPVFWHRNRPVNFIEVPDPELDYVLINDVPHGAVTREIYWSEAMRRWQRCMVYTPPGARVSGQSYPVLYLQHGATENETVWVYNGRVAEIMDNMLARGLCVPCIVVMNNGMVSYGEGAAPENSQGAFADSLLGSCIPYIEKNYPVRGDKWSRAIAGLSMGSGQCAEIAYRHPELFGYIGMFSGRLGLHTGRGLDTRDDPEKLELVRDTERFAENFRVCFRGMGERDETSMFPNFFRDDALLAELGIDKLPCYVRKLYPGQTHEFGAWRRMLYDFVQLLFRG